MCAVRTLPQVDGRSLSPLSSGSKRAWSALILTTVGGGGTFCSSTVKRITPLQLANPTGTFSTPMGVVEPPIPLADSGFSRLHSTRPGDRVPASNLHHIFSCCSPMIPSLGTSIPQDFSRVQNLLSYPLASPHVGRVCRLGVVLNSLGGHSRVQCPSLRILYAVSAVGCSSASNTGPALLLCLVWDRRSGVPSARH